MKKISCKALSLLISIPVLIIAIVTPVAIVLTSSSNTNSTPKYRPDTPVDPTPTPQD